MEIFRGTYVVFIFIAGSYTPFCLVGLQNSLGWAISHLSLILLAAIGCLFA